MNWKLQTYIFWSAVWNVMKSFFLYFQAEVYRNILKLRSWPLAFILNKAFFKKAKIGLKLISLPHSLHDFWENMFHTLYFINWPNFITWLLLFLGIFDNMFIVIIFCPVFDLITFVINLSFLVKPFSYMTKKSGQKWKKAKTS